MEYLENDTINTVLRTEEEAKSIEKRFKEKQEKLKADNQQAIRLYKEDKRAEIAAYQEKLADKRETILTEYRAEKDTTNSSEIAKLQTDFEKQRPEIVDYIVGEVTKVYGNS